LYVYPYPHCPRISSRPEADNALPGSVRKSTTRPTISTARSHRILQEQFTLRSREVLFRMELSEVEVYEGVVHLHLRESVEDGRHLTHTASSRSGTQDGHEKYTRARPFSFTCLPSILRSLDIFFLVHHGHSDRPIWTGANRPIDERNNQAATIESVF
jgi:hypothetical protein